MQPKPSRFRRALRLSLLATSVLLGLVLFCLAIGSAIAWRAFGKAAEGERLARMQQSPQWAGAKFENPLPLFNDNRTALSALLNRSAFASPTQTVTVTKTDPTVFATPPVSGLRITWLGHSTLLIEIDRQRFLTDPVWGPRASPLTFIGPKRWYEPPLPLADVPAVDAVLISHDHYDHLDYPTFVAIRDWKTRFVVPMGVAAHLEYWGVPPDRIVELDWWQSVRIGETNIVMTPARHASGRHAFDQNATLWAGYAVQAKTHRVYFSGDTGMFPELRDIGEKLGPFDATMIEAGAYNRAWPDWHIGPEQAIEAHRMVRGNKFIPIHWGLFDLAAHGWTEPVERIRVAAQRAQVQALYPRPGESIEPETAITPPWWPEVPWQNAQEHPVHSTGL